MRQALAVLSVLLLAGCASSGDADDDADAPTGPVAPSLVYGDCEELLGAFPVQEDAIPVPEGFAPAPLLGQGTGAIFIIAWRCNGAVAGSNATEGEFVEAFAGFSVTPPAELALEGAFAHAILVGLTTGSPLGAATYESWGVPVIEDALGFDYTFATGALGGAGAGTGTLTGPVGLLDVDMRVNVGGPNAPEAGSAARFFATEGTELVAAYDIAWIGSDGLQGQAVSTAALPGAPPATTGLGFYYVSDAPDRYTMTPFALPTGAGAST